MSVEIIFNYAVLFIGLLLASIRDIKTREVPDLIGFSLVALGLISGLIVSIFYMNFSYLLYSVLGYAYGAAVGLLFYFAGQWGGGDAKIMMGVGSLIGVNISTLTSEIPTLLMFTLNYLLVGALFGSVWILILAIKNFIDVRKELYNVRTEKPIILFRKIFLIFVGLIIFLSVVFFRDVTMFFFVFCFVVLLALFFYFSLLIRAVESKCMIKSLPVSKLTEGDWVQGKVKLGKKIHVFDKTGISLEEINLLKKFKIKSVVVKEGIPFVPSFFLAFIVTVLFENWIMLLV